jgi:hypothetical protein
VPAGRIATITSDPPDEQRGILIYSVYVRADGPQPRSFSELLGACRLGISVGSTFHLDDAAAALAAAAHGHDRGAVVLAL